MPEGTPITDFLNALADDPDKELLFDAEPVAVMAGFGLSEAQQRLILLGSLGEIRDAIRDELGPDVEVFMLKMKYPGPDELSL